MWAFLLYCHPESKLYNAPNKGDTIAETVLKDKEFKWEEKSYIMDDLTEIVLSEAEKALVSWNDTMRLRRLNLNEMYVDAFQAKDTDELVKIDKMMASTSKFFEDYRKIKKDYEDDKIRKTGKTIASLSDNDDI